ncbi:MAG: butyrate kinase [Candidatus Marinimicrobia bacterium]|nr:butyrate kinase [Candidatus Neomarinimicrobiota bacterium]
MEVVLTINPGSTSTKIGLFSRDKKIKGKSIDHSHDKIANMLSIKKQLPLRLNVIKDTIERWINGNKLVAVVGRGGLIGPIDSGVYEVNDELKDVTINCKYAIHASNLGPSLADGIAKKHNVPAFIADPVTVDEMIPEARISGVPEIERRSRLHTLNIRACVRKAARKLGQDKTHYNFIVNHMGGGISIAPIRKGRIIDVNDALLGMGPFSPERAGALPLEGIIRMARSEEYSNIGKLFKKLTKESGVKGYLGTGDMREVMQMIEQGNKKAKLVYKAMIYQNAKEIGAMATTLEGQVDRIIYTGGMAHNEKIINDLHSRVKFIAPKIVFPGENELVSLAEGGFRALDGKTKIKTYKQKEFAEVGK